MLNYYIAECDSPKYLPPYLLDFNLIEGGFSAMKAWLRANHKFVRGELTGAASCDLIGMLWMPCSVHSHQKVLTGGTRTRATCKLIYTMIKVPNCYKICSGTTIGFNLSQCFFYGLVLVIVLFELRFRPLPFLAFLTN